MMDLENYSIGKQLLFLAIGLVILFIAVMANHKNNRKKRYKKRDFGSRLKENRSQKKDRK